MKAPRDRASEPPGQLSRCLLNLSEPMAIRRDRLLLCKLGTIGRAMGGLRRTTAGQSGDLFRVAEALPVASSGLGGVVGIRLVAYLPNVHSEPLPSMRTTPKDAPNRGLRWPQR
jgi:hypothetical protein